MSSEQLIVTIGGLFLGLIGAPTLFQWVKHAFKVEDLWATVIVYASSAVLAAVALFVSGELGVADLTWANFANVVTAIVTAAIFTYKVLMGKAKSPES
jgi:hypothetical protein